MGNVSTVEVEKHDKVLEAIAKLGTGKEDIRFADYVQKQASNKWQRRAIVVSTEAIYYFNDASLECKRRMDFQEIKMITTSTSSDEFVFHIPSHYDCHFRSPRKKEIVELVLKLAGENEKRKEKLQAFRVQRESLKTIVATKSKKRRDTNASITNMAAILESLIGDTNYDILGLSQSSKVQEIIQTLATDTETVKFSDYVTKINKRGREQKRVLVLTNIAMYNLSPSLDFRRRVPIQLIPHITVRRSNSSEFIVHVLSEYDYVFKYQNRTLFVRILETLRNAINPNAITITASSDEEFDQIVMTQDKMYSYTKRSQSLSLLSRKISRSRRLEGAVKFSMSEKELQRVINEQKRGKQSKQGTLSQSRLVASSESKMSFQDVFSLSTGQMTPSPSAAGREVNAGKLMSPCSTDSSSTKAPATPSLRSSFSRN